MVHWWTPAYWRKARALTLQRERLALLIWPFLPARERTEDDAAPLWFLARMVRAIESGSEAFPDDMTMQRLWEQASADAGIRQAAADLRTLHLQSMGNNAASAVTVAPITRKQLKPLLARMNADQLDGGGWMSQHTQLLVPILSALFLFSGWMFNSIFFNHFDVPVGRYYGLSDYLAASFDGLIGAAVTLFVSLVYLWLLRHHIRQQTLENRLGSWRHVGASLLVLIVVVPMSTVMQGSQDPGEQRLISTFIVLLFFFVFIIQILVSFSRRPFRDTLLMTFVATYVTAIWTSAEMRYQNVDDVTLAEISLVTAPDQPLHSRIVSGNSLYLFLMNEQHELIAVPVDQVLSVRYPREEPESSPENQ